MVPVLAFTFYEHSRRAAKSRQSDGQRGAVPDRREVVMDPADLTALGWAVDELTNRIARLTVQRTERALSELVTTQQLQGPQKKPDLPPSLASIPDLVILHVNAPQLYVKFRCQVCLQEWIVAIPLEKLRTYQPTRRCRWCFSMVWNKPERAQMRSDQRLKRETSLAQLEP